MGTGCIAIYAIKNNSPTTLHNDELELLRPITIDSREEEKYSVDFYIADNPRTDYEQICEGLGEKLMGIKIVYSPDLCVSDINLNVLD